MTWPPQIDFLHLFIPPDIVGRLFHQHAALELSEQRRLYYVALTRAIFKLYVPMIYTGRPIHDYIGPLGTVERPGDPPPQAEPGFSFPIPDLLPPI